MRTILPGLDLGRCLVLLLLGWTGPPTGNSSRLFLHLSLRGSTFRPSLATGAWRALPSSRFGSIQRPSGSRSKGPLAAGSARSCRPRRASALWSCRATWAARLGAAVHSTIPLCFRSAEVLLPSNICCLTCRAEIGRELAVAFARRKSHQQTRIRTRAMIRQR